MSLAREVQLPPNAVAILVELVANWLIALEFALVVVPASAVVVLTAVSHDNKESASRVAKVHWLLSFLVLSSIITPMLYFDYRFFLFTELTIYP